jgi:hypothetical protein
MARIAIYGLALFTTALNLTEITCYLEYIEDGLELVTHSGLKSLTLKSVELLPYLTHCILTASGATWVQIWRALAEVCRDVSAGSARQCCAQR